MKKTSLVLSAVALAGAAYAGSSWYVGKEAQTLISHTVAQTNERALKMLAPDLNATHFNIEIRSYRRGMFSSSAQYVIHTLDSDGGALEYVLDDHLHHGPFPLAAWRAGRFAPMLAYSQADMVVTPAVQAWFDARQGQTPLTIDTQIGFGGQGVSHWTFAPFETARAERRVSFSGGYVQVVFSNGFNDSVATGHFDVYALTDMASGEKVEVRDISLNSTTRAITDHQFDHHSKASVKTLTVAGEPDTSPLELGELEVEVSGVQKDGVLDAQLRYGVARVLLEDADLGQLAATASITQLNIDALADLQATYADMARQRGPDVESGFTLTGDEQRLLHEKMRPVLAAAPSFSIEPLVWENAAGQSRASVFVALRDPGEADGANATLSLQDMIANARIDMAVERAMVVELFQQVGMGDDVDRTQAGEFGGQLFDEYADLLTPLGITQRRDNTVALTLDASPVDDRIVLNGETLTTEQLMGLALGLLFLY